MENVIQGQAPSVATIPGVLFSAARQHSAQAAIEEGGQVITFGELPGRALAKLGLLAALSIVLVFFIHFPIFPTAKFLEYDPADIPIMIATFAFGPWYGLMTTIVVAVVQGLTVSASGGIYGIIMHIIATGTFVLVAGFLYQKHKTKKGALIALLCGVVAWGLIMMPANLIITPIFTGMPVEAIRGILLPIILPFNLIKAGINAVVTFLVYKSVSPLLHR